MKFCIEETIHYTNVDRVKIVTIKRNYFNDEYQWDVKYMCNVLIEITKDFDIREYFPIVSDTCSVQIRPKGLFKTNKGYFYKGANKERVYLTKNEEVEMLDYIEKAKVFLKDKYSHC